MWPNQILQNCVGSADLSSSHSVISRVHGWIPLWYIKSLISLSCSRRQPMFPNSQIFSHPSFVDSCVIVSQAGFLIPQRISCCHGIWFIKLFFIMRSARFYDMEHKVCGFFFLLNMSNRSHISNSQDQIMTQAGSLWSVTVIVLLYCYCCATVICL